MTMYSMLLGFTFGHLEKVNQEKLDSLKNGGETMVWFTIMVQIRLKITNKKNTSQIIQGSSSLHPLTSFENLGFPCNAQKVPRIKTKPGGLKKKIWQFVGGFNGFNPFCKNMRKSKRVKIFPKFRGETFQKYVSYHHLVTTSWAQIVTNYQ